MTTIHEQLTTRLAPGPAFAWIADFANAHTWDPGTERSDRLDAGPVGVGSRFRLEVRIGPRVAPMEYRITVFEPDRRVVLVGEGSGVVSEDDIRFEPVAGGTRIDYQAEIRLGGVLGLLQPFLGGAFDKLGKNAAAGMRRVLDEQADQAATVAR